MALYNIVTEYAMLMPCPRCGGGNYRLKVSNTMSNTDTSTLVESVETAERIAHLVNDHEHNAHKLAITLDWTQDAHKLAIKSRQELRHASYEDVPANDQRIEYLWHKLWDALDGDIEQDETWGMFMDAIPGMPDLRKETVSGSITLSFNFSDLEIPGGLSGGERDDAIIEAYLDDNDFDQDYADSTDVTEY